MIVHMDKMSAPSSELAQRLYDKNIELENKRRRSAQARVPSDPNAWQQMRENYEAIILEDHTFSEQHNIEYALWQLQYRRIEEFRAHFIAASVSTSSTTSQTGKGPTRPDRVTKIRMQFKTFLSEASGFYHDLILKIRAKYGLPIGPFSEDSENQIVKEKDGKRSVEKGLISCHRCLIYLGDLARYKGLYGEGDSKSRDYAAASSYYLQAASIWPSSGNPHHQLAILATYSGDELVAVYRYFRSLAVDCPFSTARDNLIVAFEKNRQSYSQLHGDAKLSAIKESTVQMGMGGRGKTEARLQPKEANIDASSAMERATSIHEMLKTFCTRFVRLTGILFTRTSLETFGEVLSLVGSALDVLLYSGPEEELNFGTDAVDKGHLFVRLITILIFTVYNVKREAEGQTYADIVQRTVVLQNAFIAVFELMGHILKRCVQLSDPLSSYLLPGILIFLEWLACCPDVAAGNDRDDKQATVRSKFWNHCISFLNKLSSNGVVSMDDEDETFFNMSRYEEGETENRLALWEDFELRGFLPLQPAQTILDFSRKHSFGGDGNKQKNARAKRILAAGKALANILRSNQKQCSFDLKLKKFVIGVGPQKSDDTTLAPYSGISKSNGRIQEISTDLVINSAVVQPKAQLYVEGEEEDELIVFKPTVNEKRTEATSSKWNPHEGQDQHAQETGQHALGDDSGFYNGPGVALHSNLHQQTAFDAALQPPMSVASSMPQHLQSYKQSVNVNANGILYSQVKASGLMIQPKIDISTSSGETVLHNKVDTVTSSGINPGTLAVKTSLPLPESSVKGPGNRPVRHLGPPPGFSSVRPKQVSEAIFGSDLTGENPLMDYSWLDGYSLPSSMKGSRLNHSINQPSHSSPLYSSNGNGTVGTISFPFPGKQIPAVQFEVEKQESWQDHQSLESLNLHNEQLQQQKFISPTEQCQGQSVWMGRHFV